MNAAALELELNRNTLRNTLVAAVSAREDERARCLERVLRHVRLTGQQRYAVQRAIEGMKAGCGHD